MEEKIVISASRTKDLVRRCPEQLARMICGESGVRFSLAPQRHRLSLERIGALVLWTKDPTNIYQHTILKKTLETYVFDTKGVIILNLTVTGLGGGALEPGIPTVNEVHASTKNLLDTGLVAAEGIILRYDPLIAVRTPSGRVISNLDPELFSGIAEHFSGLGVRRIKISMVDYHYKQVSARLSALHLEPVHPKEAEINNFIEIMDSIGRSHGMRLDLCCHPASKVTLDTLGCIDGSLINHLLRKKEAGWLVTETPHNKLGMQRDTCTCTWSRDIGHTPGVSGCFTEDGACLYCYSHRNLRGPAIEHARELIDQLEGNLNG